MITGSARLDDIPRYEPGLTSAEVAERYGLETVVKLASNESPHGPLPAVSEAIAAAAIGLNRYPDGSARVLRAALANLHGVDAAQVIVGNGSGELILMAGQALLDPGTTVVYADPSFALYATLASASGAEGIAVPLAGHGLHDLDAMAAEVDERTRLVIVCNPNNPTSTVQTSADVEQTVRTIKQRSPETGILIDEAYLEYATKPGAFTMAKLALELPGVFISRTFSKAYGLAGMRIGYAIGQPETVRKVGNAWGLGSINELQAVAGIAALGDKAHMQWEKMENKRVRDWTQGQFKAMGFESPESETNFIFVNIRRPAVEFRDGARALGVMVGRDFPPMEKTYARISLGRMEDMEKAMVVFKQVLGKA